MSFSLLRPQIRNVVAAVVPLFETLTAQLRSATSDGTSTIDATSRRFMEMGSKAREVIGFAERQDGNGEACSTTELVRTAQRELLGMLEQLNEARDSAVKSVSTVAELKDELDAVSRELEAIERVSSKARIVALNGQMEAVRAGRQGAAFAEVANQTRDLASNVSLASQRIRDRIDRLGASLTAVSEAMVQDAGQLQNSYELRRREVTQVLDLLETESLRSEANWCRARDAAESLVADIGQTVVALQFQDGVSQRVGHVVETLEEIQGLLSEHITERDTRNARSHTEQIRSALASRYTMNSERTAHGSHTGEVSFSSEQGTVELF